MVAVDYRTSHVGEGRAYHDKFVNGPYRSAIWDLEQTILVDLLERWCPRPDAKLLDFACGTGRISTGDRRFKAGIIAPPVRAIR